MTEVVHCCRVRGCRFMNSHSTMGHRCGNCGEYGHGVMECHNNRSIENLRRFDNEVTPGMRCTFPGCPNPETHTNSAHHCHRCGRLGESAINCIIQPYNVHRGRFYNEPYLNHFEINDFIRDLNGRNGVVPIFLGMGCTLWVRVRFHIYDEPELMSLFMHSDAYGQYGESTNDLPRLEAFKDGCIEYNANSFSNFNGGGAASVAANGESAGDEDVEMSNSNNYATSIGTGPSVANNTQIINNNIPNNNQNINNIVNDNIISLNNNDFINILDNTANTINTNIDTSIDNDIINDIIEDNTLINGDIIGDILDAPIEILDEEVIACPLCRTENYVGTQIHDIRGSSDTCVVCMDRNVEIFLGGCGHACMCRECYQQIRDTEIEIEE